MIIEIKILWHMIKDGSIWLSKKQRKKLADNAKAFYYEMYRHRKDQV